MCYVDCVVWTLHSQHNITCRLLRWTNAFQWGSGIKTHSLGGACIGDTGSELQLYVVVYCTHIELD